MNDKTFNPQDLHVIGAPNKCLACHACCMFCGLPPTTTREEFNSLPQNLRDEIMTTYNATRTTSGPCLWLDQESGTCRHYEHRPKICRDFEIGGGECLLLIERAGEL